MSGLPLEISFEGAIILKMILPEVNFKAGYAVI
jgi:hypothetical protein